MLGTKLTRTMPFSTPATSWWYRDLDDMRNRMSRYFGDGFDLEPGGEAIGWSPAVDVVENEKTITLTAELPGLNKDQVQVSVDNGVLSIRGEKRSERKEEDKANKYHMWERTYGSFERSFTVPTSVDASRITADFRDGVLTVELPKSSEAKIKGRTIPIGH
jgi:HSP20 family protein